MEITKELKTYLVTGAAGKTGRAIIQALSNFDVPVKAFVRRDEQVSMIESLGADEAWVGDLRDPQSVAGAFPDVRAIYHICPNVSPDEFEIGKLMVSAAQAADVEHFVFHSVLHPQTEGMPHHWQKLRVEEFLFESGLPFTILQPTAYMQNILAHWDKIVHEGIYPIPYSKNARSSLVDLGDVAQVAAKTLTEPGHSGATYELVGEQALSQIEVAQILSDELGCPVEATEISIGDWETEARKAGLGKYQIETLKKMFAYYNRFGFHGNSNILAWLLERPPTSLAEFVRRQK